ncbi:MAG: metallophosphoesterase [Kiritimatiellia bacterium]|jgi:predicted MPP superfamily phosphohydrolase
MPWVVFQLSPVLAWWGLCLWFLRPLKLPRPWGLACALALLVLSQGPLWLRLFGGSLFWPELPRHLHFAISWGSAFFYALLLLSLLPPYRRLRIRAVALVALAALVSAYCLFEGDRIPRVRRHDIAIPGLPKAFDGWRIVHLSDLHASVANGPARFEKIVRRVNGLDADAICITGDFVDGTPRLRGEILAPLAGLRARHGVYGCTGNHETYSGYDEWRPLFESYGIRMLDDASVVLGHDGGNIAIGGVSDSFHNLPPGASRGRDPIAEAFRGVPPDIPRILLRHRPVGLGAAARNGVDLQLSGHTHGGQILGFDRLVKRFNEGHVRGLYAEEGVLLHVSPGTGQWAGFPIRFGIPSEITLLVLHPSQP